MKPTTLAAAVEIARNEFTKSPAIASVVVVLECGLSVSIDRSLRCTVA